MTDERILEIMLTYPDALSCGRALVDETKTELLAVIARLTEKLDERTPKLLDRRQVPRD